MKKFCLIILMFAGLSVVGLTARAQTIIYWTNGASPNASGSWATATNWNPNTVPVSPDIAAFTDALTEDSTNTLDGNQSIGALVITNEGTANWIFDAGTPSTSTLTLAPSTGNGTITVSAQTATINAVVAGTQGLTKDGAGTLTLENTNAYTGNTIINAGTLALANILTIPANALAHRWSFNNSLADSVGGSTATLFGDTTLSATNVSIINDTTPGNGTIGVSYISLGSNLLPTNSDDSVTIELWATQNGVESYGRIFDFGISTSDFLTMIWTEGGNLNSDEVAFVTGVDTLTFYNDLEPYAIGNEYHIACVVAPYGYGTSVTVYKMDASGNVLGMGAIDTSSTLADLDATNMWLGRAEPPFGNQDADASYNEVRIWNTALSQAQLSALAAAGPDSIPAFPSSIASTLISVANGATFDVSGLTNGFVVGGSQTLSNSAAGTGTLAGNITNNTGAISVSYASGTPAFTVTNGTLALASGSAFNINNTGSKLALGSYLIISTDAAGTGSVTGAPPSVTVGGAGAAGANALSISNSQLYLVVTTTADATKTTLTSSLNPSTYGQSVTFAATVSPAPADGETITFYNDAASIGTGTTAGGVGTLTTSALTAEAQSISAVYGGDSTYGPSSSLPLTQTVNKQTPTITWPRASAIILGQTLASSTLRGGAATNIYSQANVPGNTILPVDGFAFATLAINPVLPGVTNVSVIFTPSDSTDYNSVTNLVEVTVGQNPMFNWLGTTGTSWGNVTNWSVNGIMPTNAVTTNSLSVVNGAGSECYYNFPGITTVNNADGSTRGVVVGNTNSSGGLHITGGTFKSQGGGDIIGYGVGTNTLILDGGNYFSQSLTLGYSGNSINRLIMTSGAAVITNLTLGAAGAPNNLISLNGGTLTVGSLASGVGTNASGVGTNTLQFNGGTLHALSGYMFTNYMSGYIIPPAYNFAAVVSAGGAVIDDGGNNIAIGAALVADPNSVGGGLTKNGAGKLTLENSNTYSGATVINGGTLALGANSISTISGPISGLTHRWSFNNSLADSVGGATAALFGEATLSATNVTTTIDTFGTMGVNYISLGSNLLPTRSSHNSVTIELWATQNGVESFGRIFDFGSTTSDMLTMIWTAGGSLNADEVAWFEPSQSVSFNNELQPYDIGNEYHIACVVAPNGSGTSLTAYKMDDSGIVLRMGAIDSSLTLAALHATNMWLGRAEPAFGNPDADASYNEVRIWNVALSQAELSALAVAGPDAPLMLMGGSIASTLISVANGATFDVSGLTNGFVVGGSQTLSNSAAGTGTLAGNITNNTGAISVSYASGTPAFTVTNGTLALASGSAFNINNTGSKLASGSYLIISTDAAGTGSVTGAPPSVTVGGAGAAGANALSISNSRLYLVVGKAVVNTLPTNIMFSVTNSTLNLNWPPDHLGWMLQTNSVGLANTNSWFPYPGSASLTNVVISISPAEHSVFYRLVYP